jgi:hypothetical protein
MFTSILRYRDPAPAKAGERMQKVSDEEGDRAALQSRNDRGSGATNRSGNGRTKMRTAILSIALMVLMGSPGAFAQGGASSVPKNAGKPSVQAPIGHRQPRDGAVPSEKNLSDPNDPLSKENALLDRKIKSICRGC